MTVSRLVFLEEQVSIFDGLVTFARHEEFFLFMIVFVFSVLFPALKLTLSYLLWCRADVTDEKFQLRLSLIESLGKWSMTDVFLVALVVAAVKVSLISDVHLHWGLYSFSASILLSMLALTRLTTLARRLQANRAPISFLFSSLCPWETSPPPVTKGCCHAFSMDSRGAFRAIIAMNDRYDDGYLSA